MIPFFLAFWLGLFLTGLFEMEQVPLRTLEQKVAPPVERSIIPPEGRRLKTDAHKKRKKRDCVPADPNLKYQHLTEADAGKNSGKEARKKEEERRKRLEREFGEEVNPALTTNLLYLEKCID
jgi:hypothetical protein